MAKTKDALGSEEVASIKANMVAQLQLIENPTDGNPIGNAPI